MTCAAAMAIQDPLTHCTSWGSNPHSEATVAAAVGFFFFFFFSFLDPHLWQMDLSRPGVELELQLLGDLSRICDLYHSLWQPWILNPLSEARDQTCILMDTNQALILLSHGGNACSRILNPLCHSRNSLAFISEMIFFSFFS